MKGKKIIHSKHKSNPIYRKVPRVSRPKLVFNGQYLQAFTLLNAITSAGDGTAFNSYTIDCANNGISAAQSAMTALYKEYVFESLKLEWVPYVSPGSTLGGSQVYVGYTSNPEQMVFYGGASIASAIGGIKTDDTMKVFNAWERVTLNIPLTRRRKMFDVNSTNALTIDVLDRSTQGMILLGYNTTTVSSQIGYFKCSYVIKLMGLSNVAT
jgi:hypothetical protein